MISLRERIENGRQVDAQKPATDIGKGYTGAAESPQAIRFGELARRSRCIEHRTVILQLAEPESVPGLQQLVRTLDAIWWSAYNASGRASKSRTSKHSRPSARS